MGSENADTFAKLLPDNLQTQDATLPDDQRLTQATLHGFFGI
jgi:hypothetical protein